MNSPVPVLRPADLTDEPFFRGLAADRMATDPMLSALPEPIRQAQADAWCKGLRTWLEHGAEDLVVEVDGEPVGRVLRFVTDHAVRVLELTVLSMWRGRGVGGAALRCVALGAQRIGFDCVLRVQRVNPAAALYRRIGFIVTDADDLSLTMTLPALRPAESETHLH